MAKPDPGRFGIADDAARQGAARQWRARFIDALAISSNVTRSAQEAGISLSRAYRVRRAEPEFARQWQATLADGYLHLEMEVIRRLREGDFGAGDGQKFDFSNAVRLLSLHRGSISDGPARERDVSAAEVRASIDRKIEDIRRRMAQRRADGTDGA
jgi:hypothetical protein